MCSQTERSLRLSMFTHNLKADLPHLPQLLLQQVRQDLTLVSRSLNRRAQYQRIYRLLQAMVRQEP